MKYNTVIIGGGASGMCAAILIKRRLKDAEVVILEALDRVGKKLIVTGNGRCNITNKYLNLNAYHGEDAGFCAPALTRFGYDFTEEFFSSIGIPLCEGDDGKMYPYSMQASAVVDALRLEISRLGIEVKTGISADSIVFDGKCYTVKTKNQEFNCENIIVATGGIAGGEHLGSLGIGYKMLTSLGFKLISPISSLVQLKTDTVPIKSLNGIKVNAALTFCIDGKKQRSETGELLFTRYGISGPPVLQVSRFGDMMTKDRTVKINFMPESNFNEIVELLIKRTALLKDRTADYFFTGLFPKMLGHTILKNTNIKLTERVADFTDKQCRAMAENIYSFTLNVLGGNGFNNAQVTAGGICTDDFCSDTMESEKYKGLFATGEVLDIDGDCGGFNLQWAWSSAAAAAEGIIGKYI